MDFLDLFGSDGGELTISDDEFVSRFKDGICPGDHMNGNSRRIHRCPYNDVCSISDTIY